MDDVHTKLTPNAAEYNILLSSQLVGMSLVRSAGSKKFIINMLMPVKQNRFTHLRILLILTDHPI
jgi:flagellar biosynthesis/type III secretory pathway chaperone